MNDSKCDKQTKTPSLPPLPPQSVSDCKINSKNLGSMSNVNTKREQSFDRFLSFRACSSYLEKFTTRISNYYNVTRNGVPFNHKSSQATSSIGGNRINVSTFKTDCYQIRNASQASGSVENGSSSNNNSTNLNRNLAVRHSSRSNMEASSEKSLKLTKNQLSPAMNAQCLSPRPRPRQFTQKFPSNKSEHSHMGQISTSLVSRTNFIKIKGQEYSIDDEDFKYIEELGAGSYGTVKKMDHIRSNTIVAVKQMTRNNHPEDNKHINMDLEVLLKCNNVDHIVQCYGYMIKGPRVWIIMELMTTCLGKLLKKINAPFPEKICGKIAVASIKSLDYLKTQHSVIHRDVKPSNILINLNGDIKLCDFGLSGRLVDSYAQTKQGCEAYLAPERIQPPDPKKPTYDIRADVWSLGITLVQLALGKYPYETNYENDFLLLTKIIESDPPVLPQDSEAFTSYFKDFIKLCLQKDVDKRPKYKHLKWNPFFMKYDRDEVDVKGWFHKVYFDS